MQSFKTWLEAHHVYDKIIGPEEFPPIRHGDTFRVFHGFRDFVDAWRCAKYGISGKYRVGRTYSYENNNNPVGLFVTLPILRAKAPTFVIKSSSINERKRVLLEPL